MMIEAASTFAELTPNGSSAGELCDVQVRQNWPAAIGLILLAPFATVAALFAAVLAQEHLGQQAWWLVPLAMIGGAVGVVLLWRRRVRAYVARVVSDHADRPLDELLDNALGEHRRLDANHHLACLARELAKTDHVDVTIRACPPRFRSIVEPILVDFEARPLSDEMTDFDDLDEANESIDERGEVASSEEPDSRDRLTDHARRWLSYGGPFLSAVLIVYYGITLVWDLLDGRESWKTMAILGVFAVSALAAVLGSSWSFRRQWLVAPGGVILRESRFFRLEWSLHVFDRRQSVLIAHRATRRQWVVFVADRKMHRQATISERETDFLLRAWLSPLHLPPLDGLSDLA